MTTWTKYVVKIIKNWKAHILTSLIDLLIYKAVWEKHKDADAREECFCLNSSNVAVFSQNEL